MPSWKGVIVYVGMQPMLYLCRGKPDWGGAHPAPCRAKGNQRVCARGRKNSLERTVLGRGKQGLPGAWERQPMGLGAGISPL